MQNAVIVVHTLSGTPFVDIGVANIEVSFLYIMPESAPRMRNITYAYVTPTTDATAIPGTTIYVDPGVDTAPVLDTSLEHPSTESGAVTSMAAPINQQLDAARFLLQCSTRFSLSYVAVDGIASLTEELVEGVIRRLAAVLQQHGVDPMVALQRALSTPLMEGLRTRYSREMFYTNHFNLVVS